MIVLDTCLSNLLLNPSVTEENSAVDFSAFLVGAKPVNSYHIYPALPLFCNSNLLHIYI